MRLVLANGKCSSIALAPAAEEYVKKYAERMTQPTLDLFSEPAGIAQGEQHLNQGEGRGSIPTCPLHARDLMFQECDKRTAVDFVRKWHSRLPNCQSGPWQFAFSAEFEGVIYAVALWNTPSGRCLPHHWLELRRMACSPSSPKNTPSRFLSWMVRYFKAKCPEREKCISYQDTAVHSGTIYRACGWTPEYTSKPRVRDRSGNRSGTQRLYRWNINGKDVDGSAKVRWGCVLDQKPAPLPEPPQMPKIDTLEGDTMKREMTEEQKAKIQEARERKMQGRTASLQIGKYRIFKFDDDNLAVEADTIDIHYYPSLDYCLQFVLTQKITDSQATTVKQVLDAIKQARNEITGALRIAAVAF